jgi:hypothetical protein
VRVHVGPQAERIGAVAFTMGSDLYFAPGRYQPESAHGQQLLGHELAHVVQQRAGRVRNPFGSGVAVVQDHALEAEADRLGRHAAAYRIIAQPKRIPGAARPASSHRTGGIAVQRIKEITRTERIRWDYSKGNDDPQPVYGNVHERWVSSFSASLTIDQNHGVITQAQQGGTWWVEGHSELFLEYLDPDQHPVMERIHYTHGVISIGAYNTKTADWRSRLPRGSSWRVNTQQIDDALDAARTLQRKFAKGKLEYSQWFGTTNWQSASKTNHVSMNCKDVTDAILIEAGVLHGRQAKIYSFNSPQNIAGHNNRNSVAPDHMWLDK